MTLDQLLDYTDSIKVQIKKLDYHKDDVRHGFFGLYYSSIYDYYIGNVFFQVAKYIARGQIQFAENIYGFRVHAQRLYEVQKYPLLVQGYNGNLNRNILLNVWTSFETSVSLIFEKIITEDDILKIILKLNTKIVKAIENINDIDKEIIIDTLVKTSFIPINRKFNYIIQYKKENYLGDLEDERNFLDFVIKLRNCIIHSNGVYYGKDFYYRFNDEEFLFKNKEILIQRGSDRGDVYLKISIKLKEIFENLIHCVKDIKYIEYPDDGQNN
ncbi:hypothetical protein J2795_004226 [Chryseobacterium bernardetii]|uniref:Uncharacterized protein n=1 Tax=Chryseobacterium bernardetii TaxID=1241978 RepID=A0ACC6J149_9FLAO|nr:MULTISPECIES: hypothetical protein [Chryseobacterium]MDR6373038.1 hypothetical protein [Chryseobacterium vietnamense]MDR6443476.1 hypothetical protein [Chryseobacterium bernardetii]